MSSYPFVSVLMPIRNEAGYIERSLGAIVAQDYPADRMEIIVADGMSTDGTRENVLALAQRDARVRLLENRGRIVATGLNAAIREARGEVLLRVDGHCEIAPDYVRRCVEHLLAADVDGVGGPIETVGETFVARAIAVAMSSRFGVGGSAFRTVRGAAHSIVDTVPFPAYRRQAVVRAGEYDEELVRNQDDEYNYRLRKLGGKLLLSSEIRSRYYSRSSLRRLWRQYYEYGYWKVRVMQKHPRQMSARQMVPPAFAATLLASGALALVIPPAGAPLLLAAAGAYATANVTASVMTARARDWRALPILPAAFGALHLGYGMGFLRGLVAFRNRWGERS